MRSDARGGVGRRTVLALAAAMLVTSGGEVATPPIEVTIAGDGPVDVGTPTDPVPTPGDVPVRREASVVAVGPERERPTPSTSPAAPTPAVTPNEVATTPPSSPEPTAVATVQPPVVPATLEPEAPVATPQASPPAEAVAAATPDSTPDPPPPPPPPAPPAPAPDAWRDVHASLQTRTRTLPGPVVVHDLRWVLGDPALDVRADTALPNGGRATVVDAALARGAVAAVNGGFWLDADDPDGWLVTDGRLRSDTTGGRYWKRNLRGGLGLSADGRAVIGVPTWDASVTVDGERRLVRGVARRPIHTGDVVLFPFGTWSHPPVPSGGRFLRVPHPGRLDVTQRVTLPVLQSAMTPPRLDDPDTIVVWFDEEAAAGIAEDPDEVTLDVTTADVWSGLDQGLVAGPWVLTGGGPTGAAQWRSEGFTASHTDQRHPRSLFGTTNDGYAVITVVDGRQPGRSVGMTVPELTDLLVADGIRDAVLLDGGASSQLAVGRSLVNQPCCESSIRPVATVLLITPR